MWQVAGIGPPAPVTGNLNIISINEIVVLRLLKLTFFVVVLKISLWNSFTLDKRAT